jgi:autotransporter-associated beta strand protein
LHGRKATARRLRRPYDVVRTLAAFVVLTMLLVPTASVRADVLHWDGNGATSPNPAGGGGSWDLSSARWWNGSTIQAYGEGGEPHDAVFGVAGGPVAVTEGVEARSLRFDVGGYTISGAGLSLLGAGGGGAVNIPAASDAVVIMASVAGVWGLVKEGQGTLTLGGTNTFVGLRVTEGVVSVSADVHLGDPAGAVMLDGGTLRVTGASSLSAAAGRGFAIGSGGGTFDIQNTSNTGLTIRGVLSGTGTLLKTGAGTLRLDATNNMFLGDVRLQDGVLRFNNNNDAGPKALRAGRIIFDAPGGTATLSLSGSGDADTGRGAELRTGEWVSSIAGAGQILAATTVTNAAIGASGHDLLIHALADAVFSGTVSNLATAAGGVVGANSRNGDLTVRGTATQTLCGLTHVNGTVTVGSGAGLVLAGAAAMAGSGANLNINGGRFTLDNSDVNLSDRFSDTGSVETRGGGALTLIGNVAGAAETFGKINLGAASTTPPNPRSGALNVMLVHAAGADAATVLTFASLQRDSGRATIDFAAANAAGASLVLGQAGAAPRVLFATAPALAPSGLFTSPQGTGWATVNGADFATYDAAAGVKAVTAIAFLAAGAADNAWLGASAVVGGATDKSVASLKIAPSAGQTLDLAGAADLVAPGILLAGPADFTIRNTGAGTGGLVASATQHVYVQQATLTVAAPMTGAGALVKSGAGTLVLEGPTAFAGPITINEGSLRTTSAAGQASDVLELRGGVLEITGGGVFNRHLDFGVPSGPGRISWSAVSGLPLPGVTKEDAGSGGFAAVGADVIVDLNGLGASDVVWEDPSFLRTGYALVLGSRNADACVDMVDNIGLGLSPVAYNAREIRVIDNPAGAADRARLSGIVFSDSAANNGVLTDLLKTGDGVLELAGDNTYIGGTIVAEGTLLLAHAGALGRPAPGAYVIVGSRGGTADARLLVGAPLVVDRDLTVPSGGAGEAVLGAAAAGMSEFRGRVAVGTAGDDRAKTLNLFAADGAVVTFSGAIETPGAYAADMTLAKSGAGTAVLAVANPFRGDSVVREGRLEIAHADALPAGRTLSILGGDVFIRSGLERPVSIGVLNLHSPGGAVVTGEPGIRMESGLGPATIDARSGDHTLAAPVRIAADTWLSVADHSVTLADLLTLDAGRTLTKDGPGLLVIDGPQRHEAGSALDILGGRVLMNTPAGMPGDAALSVFVSNALLEFGSNQFLDTLSIGSGGEVRLTGARLVVLKHLVLDGIDFGGVTLTPEPATLALLALGGLGLAARRRRAA